MKQPAEQDAPDASKLSPWHVLKSVLAAAVGVQSRKNQEVDFNNKNSIYVYIAAGIVFTALFVGSVALVVRLVLGSVG